MHTIFRVLILVILTSPLLLGCGSDPLTERSPTLPTIAAKDIPVLPPPGDFVPEITNPYLAFERGKIFTYESETEEGLESNTVEITHDSKVILGVATTVVHDRVYLDGNLIEDTLDWFAQDTEGNVWYFGEDSKEILNGEVVSTHGSWEAGVDGFPGIIMLAEPEVGLRYKQEDAEGVAEDMGKVVGLDELVEIDYGTFEGCLLTAEWSLVESGPRDFKFYASGVGMIFEKLNRGSKATTVELTGIDMPGRP